MVDWGVVGALLEAAKTAARSMHQTMMEMEKAYELQLPLDIQLPVDAPLHVPSTGPAVVDHFVDQVRTANPQVKVGQLRRGPNTEQRRDKLEALGRYALDMIAVHQDEPLWDYATFHLGNLGAACFRILFDEDEWPEDSEEQKRAWPFRIHAVHPMNVFVAPGYRWPYAWVIEEQQRYYADIRGEYPDWEPQPDSKGYVATKATDVVPVVYYWDKKQHALFAGGVKLYEKRNLLGIPPYIWMFSGMGHKGRDNNPDSQAIGILRHVVSELKAEMRLRTAADSIWQRNAFPVLVGSIPAEEARQMLSLNSGKYWYTRKMEEKPDWLAPPELNPAMYALLPEVKRSIEKATYAPALEGLDTGAKYGVVYGMQVGQARLRVDAVKHAVERMAVRYLELVARYVEKVLLAKLEVEGKEVGPADIQGHYDYHVSFNPVDPVDNDRRVQTGLAMLQSGAISRRTFLRDYVGVKDVEEEEEQRLVETAIQQLVQGGYLAQAIAQNTELGERQEGLEAEGQRLAREVRGRGAPFGDRNGHMIPGEAGPINTAKEGVP